MTSRVVLLSGLIALLTACQSAAAEGFKDSGAVSSPGYVVVPVECAYEVAPPRDLRAVIGVIIAYEEAGSDKGSEALREHEVPVIRVSRVKSRRKRAGPTAKVRLLLRLNMEKHRSLLDQIRGGTPLTATGWILGGQDLHGPR